MSHAGLSHEMRGIPAVALWIKQFQTHWHEAENTTPSKNFTYLSIVFLLRVVSELPSNPKPLAYRFLMWRSSQRYELQGACRRFCAVFILWECVKNCRCRWSVERCVKSNIRLETEPPRVYVLLLQFCFAILLHLTRFPLMR